MGLLTYYHNHLQISQVSTKGFTTLFGSCRKCHRCNKFREKINWNVGGMYFVLENFFSSLLYYEYIVSKIKKLLAILR